MKSFEDLKKERILIEQQKLIDAQRKEKVINYNWNDSYKNYVQIANSQKVLENIDEAVKMEIALQTNILYQSLRDCSSYNSFYDVFRKYINDASTIFVDGNVYSFHPELPALYDYSIIRAILYFGFTENDLQNLIDEKKDIRSRDNFVFFINNYYGTDIPLVYEFKLLSESPLPETMLQKKKLNLELSLFRLRNGELMDGNYPLQYEADILKQYGEPAPTKKLTPPKNNGNK